MTKLIIYGIGEWWSYDSQHDRARMFPKEKGVWGESRSSKKNNLLMNYLHNDIHDVMFMKFWWHNQCLVFFFCRLWPCGGRNIKINSTSLAFKSLNQWPEGIPMPWMEAFI